MSFEKLHPEFERVMGKGRLERLATGMAFTEGPVWIEREQCVFFTDIPNNAIMRWHKTNGLSIYNKHSHYAIGLYLDLEERLIACEHSTKRLTLSSCQQVLESACQTTHSLSATTTRHTTYTIAHHVRPSRRHAVLPAGKAQSIITFKHRVGSLGF